ncbi:Prokaryotic membrane lipoprotein lipid attachment site profile (plasmid) [Nostoc flagelliforme CCNUN1]|uniref:Prokaryotic membrane lipoprotein lipid attachment site profile n=1 Tax=Nostoc flagelliforme CCNUN1 TaxID=2038116 RepID=A0A2K8T5P6_9NOSO|nr:Prokaryotic membrane lipoprotein lipid attachment site profile [Nostoc flagelliforme CCNUN1]
MIGRRCNRFIISSHKTHLIQKPPSALGFGLILCACPWSR